MLEQEFISTLREWCSIQRLADSPSTAGAYRRRLEEASSLAAQYTRIARLLSESDDGVGVFNRLLDDPELRVGLVAAVYAHQAGSSDGARRLIELATAPGLIGLGARNALAVGPERDG